MLQRGRWLAYALSVCALLAAAAASSAESAPSLVAVVSWQDHTAYETGWRLYRAVGPNPREGDWVLIAVLDASVLRFEDRSVRPNTWYSYRLAAFNQFGEVLGPPTRRRSPSRP